MTTKTFGVPTSDKKLGVPTWDGTRSGIIMPVPAYRFRLAGCDNDVTQQVEKIEFDMAAKTVSLKVRATILAQTMDAALAFSSNTDWHVEVLDNMDRAALYGLKAIGLKLVEHKLPFSYGESQNLTHSYKFSFHYLETMTPVKEGMDPTAPYESKDFPNVATAMAKFENKVTDDADGISDTGTLRQDSGC